MCVYMGVCVYSRGGQSSIIFRKRYGHCEITTYWVPDFDYFHSNIPPEFFMGIVLSLKICVCVFTYVCDMPAYNVSVCIYDYDMPIYNVFVCIYNYDLCLYAVCVHLCL